ncbi:hypothetical protein ABC418_17215 [Lactiplantibacillus plantarum]|uniref:hypothetical protein n=1 Tax=Lactiplantibacillus plantarum TaxID=1590 RepID=UPI003965D3D7
MQLSITPANDKSANVEQVPIGYNVKVNDVSLAKEGLKVTEINLNMRAGEKPKLTIYTDADPIMVESLLTNVKIKKNNSDE